MYNTKNSVRLVSGARPTGPMHLGHYFGAFKQFLDFEDKSDSYFVISDLHMLTTKANRSFTRQLRETVLDLLADCIAIGIDPKHTQFYLQSEVPEQGRVYTIIQSLYPIAPLSELVSFKEMSSYLESSPSLGLLGYPVMEAADLIGLQASHVTIGENNLPHTEICNAIIKLLNKEWNGAFKNVIPLTGLPNLPGWDGVGKMSKSLRNTIWMRDSNDKIQQKVNKMVFNVNGQCVPLAYLRALEGDSNFILDMIAQNAEGKLDEPFVKRRLLDHLTTFLAPIRLESQRIRQAEDYLCNVLQNGCKQVRPIVARTGETLIDIIGLPRYSTTVED